VKAAFIGSEGTAALVEALGDALGDELTDVLGDVPAVVLLEPQAASTSADEPRARAIDAG
jgi:hypothetical protein